MFDIGNIERLLEEYKSIPATDFFDDEPKCICDWCGEEVGAHLTSLREDVYGNYRGVCDECIKAEATIQNALAFSDSIFGENTYEDSFIERLYSQEDLVKLARKDLAERLKIAYAPDLEKMQKLAREYCLEDCDSFIDYINKKSEEKV